MRGHASNCSAAIRTTPDQCQCQCGGAFHGGPHTERAAAILVHQDVRKTYSNRKTGRTKRKAKDVAQAAATSRSVAAEATAVYTGYVVTAAIDELIWTESDHVPERLKQALHTLIAPFATIILNADLTEDQSRTIEAACNELHLLCSICVEILKLVAQAKVTTDQVSQAIAAQIVSSCTAVHPLPRELADVLQRALTAAISPAAPATLTPSHTKLIQLIGMITCPDIAHHHDVEAYCVKPLIGTWVTSPIGRWITSDFNDAHTLLSGRRPRRPRN